MQNAAKEPNLRRSPVAWAKFLLLIAAIVLGPALAIKLAAEHSSRGNPLRNPDPAEEARQAVARAETAEYGKRQRYWIKRIEEGEASFGEAACALDRHGDWDVERQRCSK